MKRLLVLFVLIAASVSAKAETPVILVFGDSISAGYGLERVEQSWVALLQTRLKDQEYGYQVINASVSGETTAGGLARLPRALMLHQPKIVILELGGNDGLRGANTEIIAPTWRGWPTSPRRPALACYCWECACRLTMAPTSRNSSARATAI